MLKIKDIIYIVLATIISVACMIVGKQSNFKKEEAPVVGYRVYLEGKSIGLIDSEEKLNNYINKEQEMLKKKFNVDKIYIPNDLDVVKEMTFSKDFTTVEKIYEDIKDIKPFTIKGYEVVLPKLDMRDHSLDGDNSAIEEQKDKKEEYITFYVLDKQMVINAMERLVKIFVGEEKYNNFINNTQPELKGTGEIIEDVYLKEQNKMSIKLKNISVDKTIILKEEDLNKYLLFGTTEEQKEYIVQANDTIDDIANKNKMSVEEFLIANPQIKGVNTLLYPGEKVTLGILNPLISVVEEKHVVKEETINYTTEYQYDNTLMMGYSKVIQTGMNGIRKVTQKVQSVNGEIINAQITDNVEIKPAVNEIVLKGGRQPTIVSAGNWGWPTNIPYILSSGYGWRWGKIHQGIDICGTGDRSPIYAAKDGVVVRSTYGPSTGYYVTIEHEGGYYTQYLHLYSLSRYVKVGDYVKMGDVIGDMGSTGNSTGTHLHFEIWKGFPYRDGSESYNPLLFYR